MSYIIPHIFTQGGANPTVYGMMTDTVGNALAGMTSASAGAWARYLRPLGTLQTIVLSNLAAVDSVHSDGGMIEIANGLYRFDLPDAAIAAGENLVFFGVNFDAAEPGWGACYLNPIKPSVVGVVVADAGNSASQVRTDITGFGDDTFNGQLFQVRTGAQQYERVPVTDYVSATGIFILGSVLTGTPAAGDEVTIW